MSFTAQDQPAYNLFNRNCYRIPRNQRRYVWTKRNWQDLLDDIMLVNNGVEKTHFIGSMVLYREKDRENGISHYTIIDGQQRITTLAIILSSIAFWLKCYSAENEFNGTKQYIVARDDSDKDHIMVTSEYHISLGQILLAIVNTSLDTIKVQNIEAFLNQNTISKKDKNIAAAFKFYLEQIGEAVKKSRKKPVNYLVGLRDTVVNNILYVNIIATSEEDACTIFEILNARGSALEDHELLKNFIMRGIKPEGDVDQAKMLWGDIENDLGNHIGHFVKHYATHRYRSSSQNGLSDYHTIRLANKGLPTKELLLDIRQKATYYCKLINPIASGDNSNCSETEFMVYSFFRKRRHEQIRPVLLSLVHQRELNVLSAEKYETAILFLYDFFVCYNIIGQENSNKITNIVYAMAYDLENNYSDALLQEHITKLNSKLPSRESFISAFSVVGWSHHGGFYDDDKDKERVQVILEVLERHMNANGHCDDFTIEHILDDHATPANGKIGNLIPLEEKLNNQCSGKTYTQKLEIYARSAFQTARSIISRYPTEDRFSVDSRTAALAAEIYDRVLKFKISSSCPNSKKVKQNKTALTARSFSKTIGEIIDGKKSSPEKADGYKQMSLFDCE